MRHSKQRPRVIIILGPPGSGKGTQAELLAEKFGFYHLETSQIIETNLAQIKKKDFLTIDKKKYSLWKEKKLRESGKLMTPAVITFWVQKKIEELAKEKKGIVLSGSPRTLYEGERLIPVLIKLYDKKNIKIILLKLGPKETIWRNTHRKTCQLMRHTILFTKETEKLTKCPFDGSDLLMRKDDNLQTIKVRLKEYAKRTLPLIKFFKKEKLDLKEINGEKPVVDVFLDILKVLK